jgi:hypothetical protein
MSSIGVEKNDCQGSELRTRIRIVRFSEGIVVRPGVVGVRIRRVRTYDWYSRPSR